MPRVDVSSKDLDNSKKNNDDLKSYKYLLGDYGISMLLSIGRGAKKPDSIMMLSGVPAACISGRMPVLLNLKIIEQVNGEYLITQEGLDFLKCIEEKI